MQTIIEETGTAAEETQQIEEINFASSSTSLTPELARLGAPIPGGNCDFRLGPQVFWTNLLLSKEWMPLIIFCYLLSNTDPELH